MDGTGGLLRNRLGYERKTEGRTEARKEGGTMKADSTIAPAHHEPALVGQNVVVIGGSAGIGLETARRAREEGADVILTARDPDRLRGVGLELGATTTAAFDATDFDRLGR